MSEKPTPVDIHPQDDENSRAIMAKIQAENIEDESAIRAIVDGYKFSSPEAKQYISDSIIDLLKAGDFNRPPTKGADINVIDTDAHR